MTTNDPTVPPASAPSPDRPIDEDPSLDDPRLVSALEEYRDFLASGQQPDREAFLARQAGLAPALAECLEGMEALHDTGLGPRASTGDAADWPAGTCLGDFRIIREIGRGGMGIVHEAEQLSLRRRVALKVLPFAGVLDSRRLQRFQNEAQAAACLHHSHIVPIFAVGCERGVNYYAMQYIEGQTLADLIHELRRTAGLEAPPLSPAADPAAGTGTPSRTAPSDGSANRPSFFQTVARWGVQVAEAVDHAHQLGIVHRDIKPANVLVDVRGDVWVTDFGLAHVQGDTRLTLTGDLVGTLRFMSPEQSSGQPVVDHRTDIYSLGVTLYELLTLRPAFDGKDRHQILRQIDGEEPVAPRRHHPAIPADLETIVLKAMAKIPAERYATARELADDLRRFLEHKPIQARRPTLAERGRKWARRHRQIVAASALILLLTVIGLTASTVLIAREQARTRTAFDRLAEEQDRTAAALTAEVEQRARAEESFRQARRAVDFFALVSEKEMADRPELQGIRRKLLEGALAYYRDFLEQRREDPALLAELAVTHLRMAAILNEMGARSDAQVALEQARQIEEKLVREDRPGSELGTASWNFFLPNSGQDQGLFALLTQNSVQEELRLAPDQVIQVARLAQSRREVYRTFSKPAPEPWSDPFKKLTAQEKGLVDGLKPEQLQRLQQIAVQVRGANAFNDAEVAAVLQLTAEQKKRIRTLQNEAIKSMWGPPWSSNDWPERQKRAAEIWSKTTDRILDMLTAGQREKWNALVGEPFRGVIRAGF